MKPMKKRLLSLLLTLVTILSLLPTSAFAASKTGSGIQITQDQAYWSTRLLANGTPYSYRPPLADGKLVYCMDSGLGYHYATKSFLDSYSWTSGSGADADAVLQSALTNSGLSEMDAMTVENVKWMMTYLNDCKDSNVGQLFMAVQTYVWENQSYKGEPGGDGDAGGYANADTYELYLSLIDNLLAKKAAEDAEFLKQIEAYKAQGIEASIVEDESAKWAVFAISSNRKNQSFFNYYGPRKLSVGEAKPDQPEQPVGGTGKITLTKTAAGTLKGLPGARYSIYFNGQIVGSDVTNESGELHIENAATGLWTFIETDAPSGFCVDPTPKSVYVDASEGDREYTVAAVNYASVAIVDVSAGQDLCLVIKICQNNTLSIFNGKERIVFAVDKTNHTIIPVRIRKSKNAHDIYRLVVGHRASPLSFFGVVRFFSYSASFAFAHSGSLFVSATPRTSVMSHRHRSPEYNSSK